MFKQLLTVIFVLTVIVMTSTAESIELCGVCENKKLQSCSSNAGSTKCVTIPLQKCFTFDDICTGEPYGKAYYIKSIARGEVDGLEYPSVATCKDEAMGISITQDCDTCASGTTLKCNSGNSAYTIQIFSIAIISTLAILSI
ncbi:hypothetical protein PPL_10206 [Heterostelium album PN500]|uniref:Uncharacterized protein n=1 Tax=Heterostelium pallidum (strain ATCC 26659 / Pp 5 / PN500) TaxID=670386 RepID=D3BQM1_HETP5|nr:hypothetical protein PPL_10206 [Heterostelium album PN500]EFA76441.1 hypothetical protein PPL_10206 [Heterostelium album PN500]|eukprot:XP_020428573.1 hypothetical protein PPL_10206 [Heterostelium album PN500]